jgi:hypothetical protein
MKFIVVLSGLLSVVNCAEYCYNDVVGSCGTRGIYFSYFINNIRYFQFVFIDIVE